MKVDQKAPDFRGIYQNRKTTLRKKYPLSADISLKVEVLVTGIILFLQIRSLISDIANFRKYILKIL